MNGWARTPPIGVGAAVQSDAPTKRLAAHNAPIEFKALLTAPLHAALDALLNSPPHGSSANLLLLLGLPLLPLFRRQRIHRFYLSNRLHPVQFAEKRLARVGLQNVVLVPPPPWPLSRCLGWPLVLRLRERDAQPGQSLLIVPGVVRICAMFIFSIWPTSSPVMSAISERLLTTSVRILLAL